MMPFTLESDRKQAMSFEIVLQPKDPCYLKQPTRNWLDLPSELMANILCRIGVFDILLSAQKVCTAWRKICKDPAMWTVICIDPVSDPHHDFQLDEMCKHVVDRSQGQLVEITIVEFGYDLILQYIANRSSKLKRLTIAYCDEYMDGIWTESLKKFPLLEELSLYATEISADAFETAGRHCSMLRTLKVNQEDYRLWDDFSEEDSITIRGENVIDDYIAMAIGLNLHELRHLELIGNPMSNEGLEMILDGCRHLQSLDLRGCLFLDLSGDLGKRCSQQIKCLKLPNDSLKGCPYIYKNDGGFGEESDIESYDEFYESDIDSYDRIYDESDMESYEEFVDGSDIESDDE